MKKALILRNLLLAISTFIVAVACNSGTSSSSTPAPTPSAEQGVAVFLPNFYQTLQLQNLLFGLQPNLPVARGINIFLELKII